MTAGGRAITLTELLIVLAIALAIGAISFGGALRWSDAERLASVQQGLSSAALEARSLALQLQQPIDLVLDRSAKGAIRVGVLFTSDEGIGEVASFDTPALEESPQKLRVLYELPEDFLIDTELSAEDESGSGHRLAILRVMPDGTSLMQDSNWTLMQGESVYAPEIETWTARLTFTPVDTSDDPDEISGLSQTELLDGNEDERP